ncbi:MFS transporter [uncultured Clostridium sp.]|uniref:MFS transporter n=1 Tax=uncultured Clostridium sp. TaxID=59620 RepID=UPI0025CB9DEB|nr:MFS transporter [uncultured Clostridium sp.]
MEDKNFIKKNIIKIVFLVTAIIISTIVVVNVMVNGFNKRFENSKSDMGKQYAQLISYSVKEAVKDSGNLAKADLSEIENMVNKINSGQISSDNESIEYGIYSIENGNKELILKSADFLDQEDYISLYSDDILDEDNIVCYEIDKKFIGFAPIMSADGTTIIGFAEVVLNSLNLMNDINSKSFIIIICVSIFLVVYGIFKFLNIYSQKFGKKNLYLKILFIILIISILSCSIYFFALGGNKEKIESNNFEFTEISNIASDSEGNMYVSDSGNTRIIKINKNNKYEYELIGNSVGEGRFFYSVNLIADNKENLYVLNNVMDENGTCVEKEQILKYDSNGKFKKVVYSKEYTDENKPLMKGNIVSFQIRNDKLYFFEKENDNISILSYNFISDELKKEFTVDIQCDFSNIIDIALKEENESIAVSTKNGQIFTVDKDNNKKLIISSENSMEFVPSQIETDSNGILYCINLGDRSISKINEDGQLEQILDFDILKKQGININTDPRLDHGYYIFSVNKDKIVTSEHTYAISCDLSGNVEKYFNSINFSNSIFYCKIIFIISVALVFIVSINLLSIRLSETQINKLIKPIFKECIELVCGLLIISVGISIYFVNNYEDIFKSQLKNNLKIISYLQSENINGDIVNRINNVNQYDSEDFIEIKNEIQEGFNNFSDEWNVNYYSAIYKSVDDKIVAIAYSDGTDVLFLPLTFATNDSKYVFWRVFDHGMVEYNETSDYQGKWSSGFSPVKDSEGNIVAVLEIGTDGNYYSMQSENLVKDVIINIVSIIAVLVFLFIELNIFMGILFDENKEQKLKYNVKIVRFVSFLIYSILNIPIFFIPIVMEKLLQNNQFFNISKDIATGFPLTGQMICLVIASGVGGAIADKIGWRPVFFSGIIVMIGGCFVSAFVTIPALFILSSSLIGFGLGLSSIACQSFIFYVKNLGQDFDTNEILADFNSGSYAGANCGVLFGTMLYEKLGFSYAFFVAISIGVLVFLIVLRTMPNFKNSENTVEESMDKKELFRTLFSFEILNYAVLILLPIIIVSFFVVHFFPIYSERQGISSTTAGLGYMLQGITVIYLGPQLTKVAIKYLKPKKTVILSSLIAFGGIMLFSFSPTMVMAFITIFFLGVSEAVGQSARVNYFLEMEASKLLGEGKALAVFSVFENLGTIVGPTIFALILSYNISFGMSIYGGISLILVLLFAMSTISFKKKRAVKETRSIEE